VFWLTRPPYLRWIAATGILVGAAAWDFGGRRTEAFPFAAADIAARQEITEDLIEWRQVPAGLLALPDLTEPIASHDIDSGDPVTAAAVGDGGSIPSAWWAVPIALPASAVPGTEVRLVIIEPPLTVDGIVVISGERDLLSISDAGLVAVPEEAAESVARAAVDGGVVVLLKP
jgi:SAF domain